MREVSTPGSHGLVLDLHRWHLGSQNHYGGIGMGRKRRKMSLKNVL